MRTLHSIPGLLLLALTLPSQAGPSHGSHQAKPGGSFTANLSAEPPTLNPFSSTDLYSRHVQALVLESLATRHPDTYEWTPVLAEKWTISKDGKQYTFYLRKNAKWHDGKPVTAEDVKFSFDAIQDPKYQAAALMPFYEGIQKVEILDPHTVKFHTKEIYFKNFDLSADLTVLPKHIYEGKGGELNKTLTGSGPYRLEEWKQGQMIILKRNPDWWGRSLQEMKGLHNFDRIQFRFVKEGSIAIEMLKKGQLDHIDLQPQEYMEKTTTPEWGQSVFRVKAKHEGSQSVYFIAWNHRKPLFQDRNVRLALAHLYDVKTAIKKFRYDMSLQAVGPNFVKGKYSSPRIRPIAYDPKKALTLLRAAGWDDTDKDGVLDKTFAGVKTKLSFTLLYANPDYEKYFTIYKEDAKKVGVDVQLKNIEWNSFTRSVHGGEFDAVAMGWGGGSVEPDPKQIWHSESTRENGSNFCAYKNPEVDRLIDQLRKELNAQKRIPLHHKISELIAHDQPYLFLFNSYYALYAHTRRVQRANDTFRYGVDTSTWWIQE